MTQINGANPYHRNTAYTGQAKQKAAPKGQASYAEALRTGQAKAAESQAPKTDSFLRTGSVDSAANTEAVKTTADMTMEEYKSYIHEKLSQIPSHPSRNGDSVTVHISEEGFEAMKSDPEYEQWVLGHLREDFAVRNPFLASTGSMYQVHYIGATKEEYLGQSWFEGYDHGRGKEVYEGKRKNSFWERRAEMHAENMERSAELAEERRMAERISGEMAEWGFEGTVLGTFGAGIHSTM